MRIDFDSHPQSNVYTLVGLNESGKTTILDAINYLRVINEGVEALQLPGYARQDPRDLVPISKRGNFNESIVLEVGYEFDEQDIASIRKYLKDEHNLEADELPATLTVSQSYEFEDTKLASSKPNMVYSFDPTVCSSGLIAKRRKAKATTRLSKVNDSKETWQAVIEHLKTRLPSVLYFSNFLFEFPDKIYLQDAASTPNKHQLYRAILQDVLDSIGAKHNLEKHVYDRLLSDDPYEKRALDDVLVKMGRSITHTASQNWNRIFKGQFQGKEISVGYEKDAVGWYLHLRLKDRDQIYRK